MQSNGQELVIAPTRTTGDFQPAADAIIPSNTPLPAAARNSEKRSHIAFVVIGAAFAFAVGLKVHWVVASGIAVVVASRAIYVLKD